MSIVVQYNTTVVFLFAQTLRVLRKLRSCIVFILIEKERFECFVIFFNSFHNFPLQNSAESLF